MERKASTFLDPAGRHRSRSRIPRSIWVLLLLLPIAAPGLTYERYSINDNTTNCRFCHGNFRSNSYMSLSDGQNWGNLHNLHRETMLDGDCEACHLSDDEFPVIIGESGGGDGLAPIGCVGCHGRAEDGIGDGTKGFGLAMKQRHHRLDVGTDQNGERCVDCHAEADPAVRTPVGENVLPPYYANPGTHPDIPTDPCNPAPDFNEDFAGLTTGIDNDGDLAEGDADSDCGAAPPTPGEASGDGQPMLLVTAHDTVAGSVDITWNKACSATDHTLEYGLLSQVSLYDYVGQVCNLGDVAQATWNYPGAESLYFLIVGNNGDVEGS